MFKVCKFCKLNKNIKEFNKHKQMTDGRINKCKSCEKLYKANYYKKNKYGKIAEAKKRNKENYKLAKRTKKYKDIRNKHRREKYTKDLNYRISCILRSRLRSALKGRIKESSTLKYLGTTVNGLIKHIESQFKPGMSWDNYSHNTWHIDHIKPLSKFDLTKEDQIKEACSYTNLQPLWAEENLRKSDGSS